MTTGIYRIRNVVSGRAYIGSGADVRKRWALHRSLLRRGKHHSPLLQRSWAKHGQEAFLFEVIEVCALQELTAREQHWIDTTDAANPRTGFNIAPVARSSLGRKHPPEVIALMKLQRTGRKMPPRTAEHRAALSASRIGNQWARGIPKSAEHKQKISAARRGMKMPWVSESNKRRAAARLMEITP